MDLTYITSRGKWYGKSWKGDPQKSGGIIFNIGIHFFDMLHYVFGDYIDATVHCRRENTASGLIEFDGAYVRWFLSTEAKYLPDNAVVGEKVTYRSVTVNGREVEFSTGFTELHTKSYWQILAEKGFPPEIILAAYRWQKKLALMASLI